MPHQVAVRSGVIHPKYPAAPRQWVTYMGDQPSPRGSVSQPDLSTGVQRNFGRRWGGDAESRFPRLEAFARAASLGAIGKVLSQGVKDLDDDDQTPPSGGRPPAPYGMTGPGSGQQPQQQQPSTQSPSGGSPAPGGRRHYAWGTRYRDDDDIADGEIVDFKAVDPGDKPFIDAESWETAGEIGGMKALGSGDKPFIDAESWETTNQNQLGQGTPALPQTTGPQLDPGRASTSMMPFASPALSLASGQQGGAQRRGRQAIGPAALKRIRRDLAEFGGM